jgi:hypothetical protein
MSFINKIEDVDIKSSEYFGFGQMFEIMSSIIDH